MSILVLAVGILCILIGFSTVVSIGHEEERVYAAIAFLAGILGGFLLCLCNYIGG